jgi:hypothetical protein
LDEFPESTKGLDLLPLLLLLLHATLATRVVKQRSEVNE